MPHLTKLTEQINRELREQGIDHQYTTGSLDEVLRHQFAQAASESGTVLRVGNKRRGELRLKITLSDLVELTGMAEPASEVMNGRFSQAGHWLSATASRALSAWFAVNPPAAAKFLPDTGFWGTVKAVAKHLVLGFKFGLSAQRDTTGTGANWWQGGAVLDNRGESMGYSATAGYEFATRIAPDTSATKGWSAPTHVTSGSGNDATDLRLLLAHPFSEPALPPEQQTQLPPAERKQVPLPEHVVLSMSGVSELADAVAETAGPERNTLDNEARRSIQAALVDDLPGRLDEAINNPDGLQRTISVNGRPVGVVRVRSELDLDTVQRKGRTSLSLFLEKVIIGFSGASGSEAVNRGWMRNSVLGFTFEIGHSGWKPKISVTRARSGSRTTGTSSGSHEIHPVVHRKSGRLVAAKGTVRHTVTVRWFDEETSRPPITGQSDTLLVTTEREFYEYGGPVDKDAVTFDASGRPVFADDPSPDPPPGKKPEPPVWQTRDDKKVRSVGPALVEKITGVDTVQNEVIEKLRDQGWLPKLDADRMPDVSSLTSIERHHLLQNWDKVKDQLSSRRVEAHYTQSAQGGVEVQLVRLGPNSLPEHLTLRLTVDRHLGLGKRPGFRTYVGHTYARTMVKLFIGNMTSGMSKAWNTAKGWRGALGVGQSPATENPGGLDATFNGAEGRVAKTTSRFASWFADIMKNTVTLFEGAAATAIFEELVTIRVEEVLANDTTRLFASGDGTARVQVPSELLPDDTSHPESPPQPTTRRELGQSKIMDADFGDVADAVREVLPVTSRSDSAAEVLLAAAANVDSILANPEVLLGIDYGTATAVRPQGLTPYVASLTVRVEAGDSRFHGHAPMVTGDIQLAFGTTGTTSGESGTLGVEGYAEGGLRNSGNPNAPKAAAGANLSGSRTTTGSRTDASTSGIEDLNVDQSSYVYETDVKVTVIGQEGGLGKGKPVERTVEGTIVRTIAEREALVMYGLGELSLPLYQVADVVERLTNGSLKLDRNVGIRLVRQYLQDRVSATGQESPLMAAHTVEQLTRTLSNLYGNLSVPQEGAPRAKIETLLRPVGDDAAALEGVLADIDRNVRRSPELAEVPDHHLNAMGNTRLQEAALRSADGADVEMYNHVMDQIRRYCPEALKSDLTLQRRLFALLAGKRWYTSMPSMLERDGWLIELPVRIGNYRTRVLTIQVNADLDPTPVFNGRTDDVVLLGQKYVIEKTGDSTSESWSVAVNDNAAGSQEQAGKFSANVGTELTMGTTQAAEQEKTYVQRAGSLDGANLVEQQARFTFRVELTPTSYTAARVSRFLGARPAASELTGTATRYFPDGLTRVKGDSPAVPAPRPPADPRPVPRPERFHQAELTAAEDLVDTVLDGLALAVGRKAAWEGRTVVRTSLSPESRTAVFPLMTRPGGYQVLTFPVPGTTREVNVWIEATTWDRQDGVGPRDKVENGTVNRLSQTTKTSYQSGRQAPLGRGGGYSSVYGVDGGLGSGQHSGEAGGGVIGRRDELTVFQRGPATGTKERVDFHIRYEETEMTDSGRRVVKVVNAPYATSGTVNPEMFTTISDKQRAEMEIDRNPDRGWQDAAPAGDRDAGGRSRSRPVPETLDDLAAQARNTPGFDQDDPYPAMARVLNEARTGAPVRLTARADVHEAMLPVVEARLLARALRADVRLEVAETGPDGHVEATRVYTAGPDGRLTSATPDAGFAAMFATLPPDLVLSAAEQHVDLRTLSQQVPEGAPFAEVVRAVLPAAPAPVLRFPAPLWGDGPAANEGSTKGSIGATGLELPGTRFTTQSRPASMTDLDVEEANAAAMTQVRPSDYRGDVTEWELLVDKKVLRVRTRSAGSQHFVAKIDPGGILPPGAMGGPEFHAGTEDDPHVIWFAPRVHPDRIGRVWVHEVTDTLHHLGAIGNPSGQGIIRRALAAAKVLMGVAPPTVDMCVPARLNENELLTREWHDTEPDDRTDVKRDIEGVLQDISDRGQVPPESPWARQERLDHARRTANTTGWIPPEKEYECTCPPDGPCYCGLRQEPAPTPTGTPSSPPSSTPSSPPSISPSASPSNAPSTPPSGTASTPPSNSASTPPSNIPSTPPSSSSPASPSEASSSPPPGTASASPPDTPSTTSPGTASTPPSDTPSTTPPGGNPSTTPPSTPSTTPPGTPPASPSTGTPPPGEPTEAPLPGRTEDPVPPPSTRPREVTVRPGGNLTTIAREWLGPDAVDEGAVVRTVDAFYRANRDLIGADPDVIQAGQVLRAPADDPAKGTP